MKILTVGGATRDIFIDQTEGQTATLTRNRQTDNFLIFKEGSKLEVKHIYHYTGGGATNSAVSFKRLGHTASSFFKVGNDRQGEFIIRQLRKLGINVTPSVTSTEIETGISFIMSSASGNSTILAFRGSNAHIQVHELPLDNLATYDLLYITSLSGASAHTLLPLAKAAQQQKVPIAINPGSSQLHEGAPTLCEALKYIDIFILNSDEAQQLWYSLVQTDPALKKLAEQAPDASTQAPELLRGPLTYQDIRFSLPVFFKHLSSCGPKTIVVTNGAEGVYAAANNRILFQPSAPAEIASTVGAGDAFSSCFVAHIIAGTPLEQALLYGVINSSSVISHLDAKTGLLNQAELEKRAKLLK